MADTRNPTGAPDNLSKTRSLLRRSRPQRGLSPHDKRPAGPSRYADPGMASASSPLPPGVKSIYTDPSPSAPSVAGSFRHDFALETEEDPAFNERQKDVDDG